MTLRPSGAPTFGNDKSGGGRLTPLRIVLLAVAGTLLALALVIWSAWRGSGRLVVLDMPAAPAPAPANGSEADSVSAEAVAATKGAGSEPVEEGAEVDAGDHDFFETPMQVVRRSNIRAGPTPDSTALGRAEEGTIVILVDLKPDRGYYRIAIGEFEGWIWGANIVAADPSQQPDAEADPEEASRPADEPAEAPARP